MIKSDARNKTRGNKINVHGDYGLHVFRDGVGGMLGRRLLAGGIDGVTGRRGRPSGSARRMNCKGAKGEPLAEDVDFTDRGLVPLGVESRKEGTKDPELEGSGVLKDLGGDSCSSASVSRKVAELIHFSSRDPSLGEPNIDGESSRGMKRNRSAK